MKGRLICRIHVDMNYCCINLQTNRILNISLQSYELPSKKKTIWSELILGEWFIAILDRGGNRVRIFCSRNLVSCHAIVVHQEQERFTPCPRVPRLKVTETIKQIHWSRRTSFMLKMWRIQNINWSVRLSLRLIEFFHSYWWTDKVSPSWFLQT